jgi:predicted esterase
MRKRSVSIVVVVATALSFFAAHARADAGVRYLDEIFDEVDITFDHVFGQARNSRGEMETLLFDLYQPADDRARDRGLYIWAFGSGFRFGSKSAGNPLEEYARTGWVGMAITYRLRPELPGNAFIGIVTNPTSVFTARAAARDAHHDMQAAVRYARAHADELGIDPDRIAVGGISAGGITALATAFNESDPGRSGTPGVSSRVAAAVSHAGAYVPVLQGAFPQHGAPPIAIYHGTSDEQVPIPTSPPGCVLTILAGNDCEYVAFVGRTHRTMGTDLALAFLYRHVIIGPGLRTPLVVSAADQEVTVLAGVETPFGLGATPGVVVPTDPAVLVEETTDFVGYVAGALGIDLP